MIEAIVISIIVGFAALHVAFRLLPKQVQRRVRRVSAVGFNKIGLYSVAQRFAVTPQATDRACRSSCDGCGTHATADDETKLKDTAKVLRFHPRLR